ncbi:MAG: hypothetical protein QGD96_07095 [Anaerolineae bacterium]|nr:hypothetical protein [Anaerolineae bacterium]
MKTIVQIIIKYEVHVILLTFTIVGTRSVTSFKSSSRRPFPRSILRRSRRTAPRRAPGPNGDAIGRRGVLREH